MMRYFDSISEIPDDAFPNGAAVAIGKFDGVHRGHQALIASARAAAEAQGLEPIIFTFTENPARRLDPARHIAPIMSQDQRLETLRDAGIAACVMVPFDDEFAAVSPETFIKEVLVKRLRARRVSVGPDFRFGHGAAGTVELLAEMGEQLGFVVDLVAEVEDPEIGPISSTRVREEIGRGEVALAARMLGRPLEVRGTVVQGDARGRELGFPTANLGGGLEGLVPAEGVYAGWVLLGDERFQAAISVGNNSTFTPEADVRIEAFILDFSRDIYGEAISVQFVDRIRGNITFSGMEPLIEQMHRDVERAREILSNA